MLLLAGLRLYVENRMDGWEECFMIVVVAMAVLLKTRFSFNVPPNRNRMLMLFSISLHKPGRQLPTPVGFVLLSILIRLPFLLCCFLLLLIGRPVVLNRTISIINVVVSDVDAVHSSLSI